MSLSNNYPALAPNLLLDFANSKVIDSRIGVTRASTATYFDQLGVLQTAQNNVPRIDFNPTTYACNGLLVEEARTNSIRNNTMQGAVAGTPGTVPTNWSITSTANGLTRTISTGTENGITYIDVRYAGTTTAASFCIIRPEALNQVAAASGQSWTSSVYMRVAAGSTANIVGFENWVIGADAGGAITESTQVTPAITGTMTRFTASRTMNNASTAFVYSYVAFTFNNGVAIDITLRIGLPQLEQGAFATSVIPTTTTALTRQADAISMTGTNFSSWFNAAAGTLYAEYNIPFDSSSSIFPLAAGFSDGTFNNVIINYARTIDDSRRGNVRTLGVQQFDAGNGGTYTYGTNTKQALAYATNDVAISVAGTAPTTSASVAIPTVNVMGLGSNNFIGGALSPINGWLRRISYYPLRNTNAQLQALTGT